MLPIIWRASDRSDLAEIIHYVADANPAAARRLRKLLMETVLPVSEHPYLYRQSKHSPNLREIVAHPNYIAYYRAQIHSYDLNSIMPQLPADRKPRLVVDRLLRRGQML